VARFAAEPCWRRKTSITGCLSAVADSRSPHRRSARNARQPQAQLVSCRPTTFRYSISTFPSVRSGLPLHRVRGRRARRTLVNELLHPALEHKARPQGCPPLRAPGAARDQVDRQGIVIDQRPDSAGTPRLQIPPTYTGAFRSTARCCRFTVEAQGALAATRWAISVSTFKGGRCEACSGQGVNVIEMQLPADVYDAVRCLARGPAYKPRTLQGWPLQGPHHR